MNFIEILKAVFLGIVEGVTEWLPISSTGHLILVDEFMKLNVSPEFWKMFVVVIQLGAIMAVVVLFWNKLFPFKFKEGFAVKSDTMRLWGKILIASIPALIIGLPFDDFIDAHLSTPAVIAATLIIYGIIFIVVENHNKHRLPAIKNLSQINYRIALLIGVFQMLALIPGTSRSGATIVGAILIGCSRTVAAEFTFFLAIPAMFGGSAIRLLKFGANYSADEVVILAVGVVVSFLVSIFVIKFLMNFIKKHDFKVFGWYRIALGAVIIAYFGVKALIGA